MVLLESNYAVLNNGDKAPNFSLESTDGTMCTLSTLKAAKSYLVLFMCNHCPYVQAKLDTLKELHVLYKDKGLVIIGINPNDPVEYPEDGMDEMKRFVKEGKIPYLYLQDKTQEIAQKYGAVCTPDPFLFDSEKRLVYHGRIDNAYGPGKKPTTKELHDVIKQLLSGKPITVKEMPSIGCSIKWKGDF